MNKSIIEIILCALLYIFFFWIFPCFGFGRPSAFEWKIILIVNISVLLLLGIAGIIAWSFI